MFSLLMAAAIAASPAPAAPMPAPTQWEYNVLESYGINAGPTQEFMGLRSETTAKYLNQLGAQGWELVTAVRERDGERVYFVFKRPIPPRL